MERRRHLGIILLLLAGSALHATTGARAEEPRFASFGLRSDILAEEVAVSVYLPAGYEGTDTRYPCLYILEDDLYSRAMTGTTDAYTRLGKMPGVIVIGVATSDRWRDFTPTHAGIPGQEPIPLSGGGGAHRDFLARELFPRIDRTYRTQPYRILFAHSLAGLHALATAVASPGLFGAVLVTSPSLWWDDEIVTGALADRLDERTDLDIRLFLATGGEDGTIQDPVDRFCAVLDRHPAAGPVWTRVRHEDASHQEVPLSAFGEALDFVFPDWSPPPSALEEGIAAVDAHYAMLSARYGYRIEVPERTLNRLGYRALNAGDLDLAVELFERNAAAYPASSNVHDSLGEGYLAQGRRDRSRASYARAAALADGKTTPRPADDEAAECNAEVVRMNAFFRDWYRGDVARTDERALGFADALTGDFELITSRGAAVDRSTLVTLLDAAWGSRPDMELWTDEVRLRCSSGDLRIVSYVEHGRTGSRGKATRITAVLRRSAAAAHGLEWVRLHEAEILD